MIASGIRKTILTAHAMTLAVGVGLSTLIYLQGQSIMDVTALFVQEDLPALKTISSLKVHVAAQEPILYEYYATVDRDKFWTGIKLIEKQIDKDLRRVRKTSLNSEPLDDIKEGYKQLTVLAAQLDDTLKSPNVDWDRARSLLAVASDLSSKLNTSLDALVLMIQDKVSARGLVAERKVKTIIGLVMFFSGTLFLVVLIVGYYVNTYLSEVAERRRLAMFPERNPKPVLTLGFDGKVLYANAGAIEMVEEIGTGPASPAALFPSDLYERLATLFSQQHDVETWEYAVADRTMECSIHLLRDLEVFHAYLSDISERKRARARLRYQAYHHSLTELPNRRMFMKRTKQALRHAGAKGAVAVLLINVDRFRTVIDSLGHVIGDQLLQGVAERLHATLADYVGVSPGASLYHFDGVQFAMLLPGIVSNDTPAALAEHITSSMTAPLRAGGREFFVTFSVGVSLFPVDGTDSITLVKNADTAMQCVRQYGGNGFQCYVPDMNARAVERLEMGNALRYALERQELFLHYQPQVDIPSGRIVGVEALVRWQHPERGIVFPADFIPLAEETGLIVPIGEWILTTACAQNKAWQSARLPPLTVAVNISARQFEGQDLPRMVTRVLKETGLPPETLELEVTESVVMDAAERVIITLHELKDIGVILSIDDFGTGYSSLSYLKRFPIDKLKVDQSFVRDLNTDINDAAIARAVIALGHSLKLKVIAEGVETDQQLAFLSRYQCEEMQGDLFSSPVPAERFVELIRENRR